MYTHNEKPDERDLSNKTKGEDTLSDYRLMTSWQPKLQYITQKDWQIELAVAGHDNI